jgi:hypothetical protein
MKRATIKRAGEYGCRHADEHESPHAQRRVDGFGSPSDTVRQVTARSRLNPSTTGLRAISQYRNRGAMPSLVVAIAQHIARDALWLDTE